MLLDDILSQLRNGLHHDRGDLKPIILQLRIMPLDDKDPKKFYKTMAYLSALTVILRALDIPTRAIGSCVRGLLLFSVFACLLVAHTLHFSANELSGTTSPLTDFGAWIFRSDAYVGYSIDCLHGCVLLVSIP